MSADIQMLSTNETMLWPLRSRSLEDELNKVPAPDAAVILQRLYLTFGQGAIEANQVPVSADDPFFTFVAAAPAQPQVSLEEGGPPLPMRRIPGSDVWILVAELPNRSRIAYSIHAAGRQLSSGSIALDRFALTPESLAQPNTPRGTVTSLSWESDSVYPNTIRHGFLYTPAQYDGQPACSIVFLDGNVYAKPDGAFRAATVLDNLIASKRIPVTVAIFIDPGTVVAGSQAGQHTRSLEYDTPDDTFARLLIEEICPDVARRVGLRTDAASRAICGISSSGLAAFNAAWRRPDAFSRVLSHCGSFTNIRGGHIYPDLVRRSPRKPLRVCLQAGAHDLNIAWGDWYLANLQMASALRFAGYPLRFVESRTSHQSFHGGADLPQALQWLLGEEGPATKDAMK